MSHPAKSKEEYSPIPPNGDVRLPAETNSKLREKATSKDLGGGHERQKEEKERKSRGHPVPPRGSVWEKSNHQSRLKIEGKKKTHNPIRESSKVQKARSHPRTANASAITTPHPQTAGHHARGPRSGLENGAQG